MIWCYMDQMSVNEQITWRNQCVQGITWVEEVWYIGGWGLGKTLGLNTQDAVAMKEYK